MRIPTLLACAALLASCGGSTTTGTTSTGTNTNPSTPATPVATTSVTMQGSAFAPPSIQVAAGAAVTFTNSDGGLAHNVTFTNTAIGATANYTSGSQTLTMPTVAGTYPYRCTLHGGMTGSVTVK